MSDSTGLSVIDRIQDPKDFIVGMGKMFALSQMFGCKTEPQGIVLALHCVIERVSPLKIMAKYHFIDGKLRMKSAAMLAEFRKLGGKHEWVADGTDGKSATIKLTLGDQVITSTFTMEDAQRQKLVKPDSAWTKTPANMLRWRAVSNGVDMICPEAGMDGANLDESDDPVDGEIIDTVAVPAAQSPTAPEPAKRTRKTKETTDGAVTAAPVEAATEVQTRTSEPATTSSGGPVGCDAAASIATAVAAVVTEPAPAATPATPVASPVLPQIVVDIVALRDYVGPRWPKGSNQGDWATVWAKVRGALKVPECATDEESFTKSPDPVREKTLSWLKSQQVVVDKLSTSKDLNTWANQTPTTAAAAAS